MSYSKALGTGIHYKDTTFAQLTAPGNSTSEDCVGLKNHVIAVTVASVDTNVVVEMEGSHDGTNWFDVPIDSQSAVAGMSLATNRGTITVNGTYGLVAKSTPLKNIRLNWVSEAGGTAATVDAVYHGSN